MRNENDVQFARALKIIHSARKKLTKSLRYIQNTPVLSNEDVSIISNAIDTLDISISKLTKSFRSKRKPEDWNEKN